MLSLGRLFTAAVLLLALVSCAIVSDPLTVRNEFITADTERSFRLSGLTEVLVLKIVAPEKSHEDDTPGDVLITLKFNRQWRSLFYLRFYEEPCSRLMGYSINVSNHDGVAVQYVENAVELGAPLRIEYLRTGMNGRQHSYSLMINEEHFELPLLSRPLDLIVKASVPLEVEYLGKQDEMDKKI